MRTLELGRASFVLLAGFVFACASGQQSRSGATGRRGAGLSGGEIQPVVESHFPEVRNCYERAAQGRGAEYRGSLTARFEIAPNGRTRKVHIDNDLPDDRVARCVAARIGHWRFPSAADGASTRVSYPFSFRSNMATTGSPQDACPGHRQHCGTVSGN